MSGRNIGFTAGSTRVYSKPTQVYPTTLPGGKHGRSMDDGRSKVPHKLPGAPGCIPGDPDVCKMQGQPDHLYSVGQRDSSNIHQQEVRNEVHLAIAASKEDVDLVHGEEHICEGKHDSRRRITGAKGS